MSEERDPLNLDAETLMKQNTDNIEFVVDESDGENEEAEAELEHGPGGVEDITIVVESDDDSAGTKSQLGDRNEHSIQPSSYIDDYPDLEEVPTDQINRRSKRILESKDQGTKRSRDSDEENFTPKKGRTHKRETSTNSSSSSLKTGISLEIEDQAPKLLTNPCFVPGCQLPKGKKVYFFRVPRNKILFQLWDLLIKRPGVRLTSQCLVCQQHFHKDDILAVEGPKETDGRLLALKKEALPCISYVQRCPVINCGLRAGPSQQFPILEKNNFAVWLERLGNPRLKCADILYILRHRVCNGHFSKECFDKNGELKSGSAPSVNIPEFPPVAYMSYPSARDLVTLPTPPLTGRCAFDRCADKAKKKQKVYPLPSTFESLVKWLAATGHPNWIGTTMEKTLERVKQQVSGCFGVCLDHFTSYDFVDASLEMLANTAVPTRKGDREDVINYAVEVKNVVPVSSMPAGKTAIPPTPGSDTNNMVILLPNNAPTGQVTPTPAPPVVVTDTPVSLVLPINASPQQTSPANVTTPLNPILPAAPPGTPGNMVPLLVSNNGDTKVMLVPQELITATNPDFLQNLLTAAVSTGSQPQTGATPNRSKGTAILPKPIPTTPRVTNNLPRIPTPKVTPSMRRALAANTTPTATIDLTETSEKGDENEPPKTVEVYDAYSFYMKKGCCYVGCTAQPSAQNPLYNFPADVERRKEWLRACGRVDTVYYRWLQICKMHFTEDCFHEEGYLLPDAVPVQNKIKTPVKWSHSDQKNDMYSNGNKQTPPGQKLSGRPKPRADGKMPCAVLRCMNVVDKEQWTKYRFPNPAEEPDRFQAWNELVYNPTLKYEPNVIYEEYVVCEKHFEKVYYKNGDKSQGLVDVAVPTWMVPGKRCLKSLQYYKDKVEPYLKEIGRVTVELVETDDVNLDENQKTVCVLEKDKITLPGLGNCLKFTKHDLNRHAYTMYKKTQKFYAAVWDLEEGESMKIHTAIIIDDNEECEKAVLQQILDTQHTKQSEEQKARC